MLESAKQQKTEESTKATNSNSNSNYDEARRHQGQSEETTTSSAAAAEATSSPPKSPSSSSVVVDVNGSDSQSSSYDLAHFDPIRILNNNSTHKCVTLLGHFGNLSRDNYAIVVLEKTAFTEAQLRSTAVTVTEVGDGPPEKTSSTSTTTASESEANSTVVTSKSFFSARSQLRTEFINDIYGNFLCVADPEVNQIKVTIIYPASEKHIVKFSAHKTFLVEETADDYQSVTLPHLEQEQLGLEWLYNILEHRKEKERIVFEDPSEDTGFILLPDLKWDGKTVEQLYLLALARPREIKSLRDLTAAHLPLLRNIRDNGTKAIRERYGIGADQLRIYIHYQPTFYHLHVHFTYLKHDPAGTQCDKSHLLSGVIGNLELVPDYYQRATLTCVLKETDKLYEKFQAARKAAEEPVAKRAKLE